jgi:hypothetical protein
VSNEVDILNGTLGEITLKILFSLFFFLNAERYPAGSA